MNNHPWDAEFGIYDASAPGQASTSDVTLAELRLRENKRFLYLFDYGAQVTSPTRSYRISRSV